MPYDSEASFLALCEEADKDFHKKPTAYEFSNGRKFEDPEEESAIYGG